MTGLRALTRATVLCLGPLAPCLGADLLSPVRMEEKAPDRGFVFAGLDATSHGTVFAHAGLGAALDGDIDASGPVLRLFAGGGQFSYELGHENRAVDGTLVAADALAGYQWVKGQTYLTLLGGGALQHHELPEEDGDNPARGTEVGVKGQAELYSKVAPDWLMAGALSYSTAHGSWYGRAHGAYRVFGDLFLGPEIVSLGSDHYRQERLGLHVSEFRMGPLGGGLSAGAVEDEARGPGLYGSGSAWFRF